MIIGINGEIGSGKDTVGKLVQLLAMSRGSMKWYDATLNIDTPQSYIDDKSLWQVKKFAGKLKQIASLLTGIAVEKFEDQEFKSSYLPSDWNTVARKPSKRQDGLFGTGETYIKPMTVREFLQNLGTDAIRNWVHENAWVNALMADYKPSHYLVGEFDTELTPKYGTGYPDWLVTDCRFPNEAQAIKDKGGLVIRVVRDSPCSVCKLTQSERRGQLCYEVSCPKGHSKHISETALDDWDFDYRIINDGSIEDLTKKVKEMMSEFNLFS